MNRKNNN